MQHRRPAHPSQGDDIGAVALGPSVILEDADPLGEEGRDVGQDLAQVEAQVDGSSTEPRHAVDGDDLLGPGAQAVHHQAAAALLHGVQD